jgi:DNA polymerase III subunit epsilon
MSQPCGTLVPMRYAFVDLETTGMSPGDDRVTEIGIVCVDEGVLVDEWSSLVDPGVPIPPDIQTLTGITNEMVRGAPRFVQLLAEISPRLAGRVFVAHNARFDYGFVKAEHRRVGERFSAEVLCTVRLSRRLFPEYGTHRLDALIDRHRLPAPDRHRALGDARVIRHFLDTLHREHDADVLAAAIRELLKLPATPPHLVPGALDALPEAPGVYVFDGANGQPLYVGKARNLRDRVRAHFYADSRNANDARLAAEVHALRLLPTAGEFGALLREMQLIKSCAPLHNVALRRRETTCFLRPGLPGAPPRVVRLSDLPGADPGPPARHTSRTSLDTPIKDTSAVDTPAADATGDSPLTEATPVDAPTDVPLYGPFGSRAGARAALAAAGRAHRLCDRALGLWAREGACFSRQVRRCNGLCTGDESSDAHHARLLAALAPLRFPAWPFDGEVVLHEHDPETGRRDSLRFDRWRAIGPEGLEPFDPDVFKLLRRQMLRTPQRFETPSTLA